MNFSNLNDDQLERIFDDEESLKEKQFLEKHGDKLKNKVLAARVRDIIYEANEAKGYIDQETALEQAESEIAELAKPVEKEDLSALTADEFKTKLNIPEI